jgi:hypothetical protein
MEILMNHPLGNVVQSFRLLVTLFGLGVSLVGTTFADDAPADTIQGNWLGVWTGKEEGSGGKTVAQIYGLGNGEYQAVLVAYDSGEQDSGTFTFSIRGTTIAEGKVQFLQNINLGPLGMFKFEALIEGEKLSGRYSNGAQFEGGLQLARHIKKIDAVGLPAPAGAIVLFDGKTLDKWTGIDALSPAWEVRDGRILAPVDAVPGPKPTGHLVSRDTFTDAQIHLEFRLPYEPEARKENRAAGGVWIAGRYEIQFVDSFGFPRERDNLGEFDDVKALGAIYGAKAPKEQPGLPPGEWQALDITFTSARGTNPADITVVLNGTTIHDHLKLDGPTEGAPIRDAETAAGLILERSGHPLEFRNVWYVPLANGK